MAFINWYPGHMTKSIRMIEENIRLIDVLIYVLDARAPRSCINPDFNRYIQKLPVIYVLNKSDLADSAETEKWRGVLSGPMSEVVSLNSTVSKSSASVMASIRRLCGGKIDKYAAKGVKTTIKAMVLGVPNTGKSTLINNLIGKGKAVTGNKAGVTRGKQWFNAGEYTEILDTPGTLYPKLSDQTIARHLAYLGSIKVEQMFESEISCQLLKELSGRKPDSIVSRYGFVPVGDGEKDLDAVCHARSFMLKGGLPDTERASKAVIEDFRKGRLGKITLDFAEDA